MRQLHNHSMRRLSASNLPGQSFLGTNIVLRIDVALQVVPCNMYVAIKTSIKVVQKVDSCNMSRKHDTVLRGKSMLQVDPCNTAFMLVEYTSYLVRFSCMKIVKEKCLVSDLWVEHTGYLVSFSYMKIVKEKCLAKNNFSSKNTAAMGLSRNNFYLHYLDIQFF